VSSLTNRNERAILPSEAAATLGFMTQGTKIANDVSKHPTTRRQLLRGLGSALAALPVLGLWACAKEDNGNGGSADGADEGSLDEVVDPGAWATGGTAAMSGSYPDPFATSLGSACALTCAATLGPCYAETVERKDISEGQPGLPVRMVLMVVDEACLPIAGATVDVWHCGPTGLYSGDDASDMCTGGDEGARAARWFRGVQTTDARGRVEFDTCFPGWYSSRTIHVHFTVRVGETEFVTSQLVFDDALDDEIVASQPIYKDRGARDTLNTNDNVVGQAAIADYTFQTQRMADGAMLAWKALVLRSSTADALCSIGGGPGGPGGPPPGGF
jgi:protocatechuate 3,4-dioxygenase beta subunit